MLSGLRATVCPSTNGQLSQLRAFTSDYRVCPSYRVSHGNKPTGVSSLSPASRLHLEKSRLAKLFS